MVVLGHVDLGVVEIPLAVAGIRNTVASSAIVSHELACPRLGLLVKGIKVAPVDMRRRSVLLEDGFVAEPEPAGGVLLQNNDYELPVALMPGILYISPQVSRDDDEGRFWRISSRVGNRGCN